MAEEEKQKGEEDKIKLPPIPSTKGDTEKTKEAGEIEEIKTIRPESKSEQAGFVWTPKLVRDIMKFLIDFLGEGLADKFLAYKKNEAEARRHYFETVSSHNRNMVYVLGAFLIGIVAFMSILTVLGAVSGDALLFLVGTITGYLLLFIQRLVFPSEEAPPTEKEAAV